MKQKLNYSFKSPSTKWDYIVIGSGMGGMTAAGILAHLGRKVLIVEQHYVPGGFTHAFKRQDWEWDVGVHAIGEVTDHSLVGRVLNKITEGELSWNSLGEVYEQFFFPGDFRIDFPDHPQKFKANLKAKFPKDGAAIDAYFDRVKQVAQQMRRYFLSRTLSPEWGQRLDQLLKPDQIFAQTTEQVLTELTANEKLKTVLGAQWGYHGALPDRAAFAMQALVMRHLAYGAYYPVGGASAIAKAILAAIAKRGGWTRVRSPVESIDIDANRAVGVILSNGETIKADNVISSVGAIETVSRLLPKELASTIDWSQRLTGLKPSPCHLCLHVGFDGDIRTAGATAANQWFYETWTLDQANWNFSGNDSPPHILYTSYPSLKDPLHTGNAHTAELVTFVPYEAFADFVGTRTKKRGEEYKALKEDLSKRMLKQLVKYMPKLEPMIKFTELSTPLSTEHYTRSYHGAIYGIEPTPDRFTNSWIRAKAPIKNLYMAGSDIASVGVIGAMVGGVLAAVAAQPIAAMRFLNSANRSQGTSKASRCGETARSLGRTGFA